MDHKIEMEIFKHHRSLFEIESVDKKLISHVVVSTNSEAISSSSTDLAVSQTLQEQVEDEAAALQSTPKAITKVEDGSSRPCSQKSGMLFTLFVRHFYVVE